jgi:hypothetical protein
MKSAASLIFTLFLCLYPLHGALIVDKTVDFSDTNGPTTHLRFSRTPPNFSQNNVVKLSFQGRLALLDKPLSDQNTVLRNSAGDLMAFNIRKAICDFDSTAVLEEKDKIIVISHIGDQAYALYTAKFGGDAKPSTVVTEIIGNTINLTHIDKDNPDGSWVSFSVRIEPDGIIKLK